MSNLILTEEELREQLNRLLGHDGVDGTYYYCLTRVKEAFNVGTMTLDDFVEIDEQLTDELVGFFKPQIDSLLSANAELSFQKNIYKKALSKIVCLNIPMPDEVFNLANDALEELK